MTYKYVTHIINCETGNYIRSDERIFTCSTINALISKVYQFLEDDMDCDFGGWSIYRWVDGDWQGFNYKRLRQIYGANYWTEKRRIRAQQEYELAMKQLEEFARDIIG